MTAHELPLRGATHSSGPADGFADSFSLFALIVMSTFVIAIGLAIVGLSSPGWLGFN